MPSCNLEKLRKAAQHGINSSAVVKEAYLLASAEVLVGLGNLVFGSSKLLQSVPFSALPHLNNILRHGTAFSTRLDSAATQKNFLVGTLSRSLSTPSVSGPAYQICGYHIDSLCADPMHSLYTGDKLKNRMAAYGFKATLGDLIVDNRTSKRCYHTVAKNYASASVCSKGVNSYRSARMSLKNDDKPNHSGIYGYFVYSAIRSRYKIDLDSWSGWKDFHHSASTARSSGAASDVFNDTSLSVDQVANSSSSSEQKLASERTLKLLSASCYLPHPEKEETGGEDAHFICSDEHAIGVADGVGGWAEVGINAGLYARELMSNSVDAIREEPKGLIDPARVLEKAHSLTRARGSSTACIIALTTQGLHAINLGDSGFIVVRDGRTVFQSPVQQHDFNLTYQLECGPHGDLPSSGQVFSVPVAPGDVVVAGTDGLFDNLYNNEVTAVVVHALRAGFGPQVTAQKIAALARQRAQDSHRQTPFSTAAQDAGIRYYGGKLDDITVVVSYITSSANEQNASC